MIRKIISLCVIITVSSFLFALPVEDSGKKINEKVVFWKFDNNSTKYDVEINMKKYKKLDSSTDQSFIYENIKVDGQKYKSIEICFGDGGKILKIKTHFENFDDGAAYINTDIADNYSKGASNQRYYAQNGELIEYYFIRKSVYINYLF